MLRKRLEDEMKARKEMEAEMEKLRVIPTSPPAQPDHESSNSNTSTTSTTTITTKTTPAQFPHPVLPAAIPPSSSSSFSVALESETLTMLSRLQGENHALVRENLSLKEEVMALKHAVGILN